MIATFLFLESNRLCDVLLVGELRNVLTDMSCPLTLPTSEILGPPELNKVTGEKWLESRLYIPPLVY